MKSPPWTRRVVPGLAAIVVGLAPGSAAAARQVAASDSAGVRIVSSSGPDRMLEAVEVLRFGQIEGNPDFLFDQIRSVALDSDGTLLVVDSHEAVRHYSQEGEFLGSVGAAGNGPGESPRGYYGVWAGEETVYVIGFIRYQLFDRAGHYLGATPPLAPGVPTLWPLGQVSDRWLFRRHDPPVTPAPGARMSWTVVSGVATEWTGDSLFTVPGPPLVRPEGQRTWSNGSFFDGVPSMTFGGGGRVYYSHPTEYQVDVYSGSGTLEGRIRRVVDRQPYPRGLATQIEAGLREDLRGRGQRLDDESVKRLLDAALPDTSPDLIPALDLVLAASDGSLWVRRADKHPRPAARAVAATLGWAQYAWREDWKAPSVFDLFQADGSYRGTVSLPSAFVPYAVAADRVFGSMVGLLDVPAIVAFEVRDRED